MNLLRWIEQLWGQLRVRIIFLFAAIALITYIYSGLSAYQALQFELPQAKRAELERQALELKTSLEALLANDMGLEDSLQEIALGGQRGYEIRLYDPDGNLLFSTIDLVPDKDSFWSAIAGGEGYSVLYAPARSERYLSLSVLLSKGERAVATLELASSLAEVDRLYAILGPRLLTGMVFSLVAIAGAGLYISRNVIRILKETERAAHRISQGDFDYRIEVTSDDEVGQLTRTINQMAQELQQLSQARAQFLSKVSHELRTPLTIIKGFCVTLLRESPPPDQQRSLQVIDRQTDYLTRLVTDLLELSRSQAGSLQLQVQSVDLVDLAQEVVESLKPRAGKQNINLLMKKGTESAVAEIDLERIRQVMYNLLDNALKHTDPGGTVKLSIEADDAKVTIQVRDNGHGIPSDKLPYVFDSFFQVEPQAPGAGLGLAVVRELVEAHGGTVSVESEVGKGSTFTLSLGSELLRRNIE
jgi:signal transduction histidine kinase